MAKPAEESHGEALRRDSAFRRMVQFCGPGVPPMLVCSLAQLDDALSLTTTVAEMLADAHSSRNGWRRGRVDVLDSEGKFAFVAAVGAALFGAAIGENTLRYDAVLRVEGQDPAVSENGGHHRRLAIIELGEAGLGIGVDESSPIDPVNPFQRAHMECVPRRKAQGIPLSRQSEL